MLRTLTLSLSPTCTVVGGRCLRPSVAVVDGRRFRPTSGNLEPISTFMMLIQQQSEHLVEEWNMLTTIRTTGRRSKSVVGCKQIFFVLMDAAILACTFPRRSVVVNYNQLYSEMRNDRVLPIMLPRECFVLYCKTVEHRSGKSRDLLQTKEFTSGDNVTHFSASAGVLLHTCSFVSHPSLRTAQGGILNFGHCVWKHSILARSVFVSHGHRLCRDIVVVLIASIAIWIYDILW